MRCCRLGKIGYFFYFDVFHSFKVTCCVLGVIIPTFNCVYHSSFNQRRIRFVCECVVRVSFIGLVVLVLVKEEFLFVSIYLSVFEYVGETDIYVKREWLYFGPLERTSKIFWSNFCSKEKSKLKLKKFFLAIVRIYYS